MAGTLRKWALLPDVEHGFAPETDSMFSVFCPHHQAEVLLGYRGIKRVENDDDGILVHWTCYCGYHGRTRTGVPRRHSGADALA